MIKKRALANRDIAACILLLIAIIAWFRADIFGHELLAQISILAIFAMSLDLLTGYTGLVSLGHAAFYGVGAYATAGLAALAGWPMCTASLRDIPIIPYHDTAAWAKDG